MPRLDFPIQNSIFSFIVNYCRLFVDKMFFLVLPSLKYSQTLLILENKHDQHRLKNNSENESNDSTFQYLGTSSKLYLKIGHFILNKILSLKNGNTAILHTVVYLLSFSPPVKALIRTFEVCLLTKNKRPQNY